MRKVHATKRFNDCDYMMLGLVTTAEAITSQKSDRSIYGLLETQRNAGCTVRHIFIW